MVNMRTVLFTVSPLLFLLSVAPSVRAQGLPDGPGRKTFEDTCGGCHGADIVVGSQGNKERWADTVDAMKARGATASDDDFKTIIAYLSKYFGNPVNVNKAAAKDMASDLDITADEAAAIVKYRTDKGSIKDWADLGKVSGLDMKKLEPIKTRVTF